MRTDDGSIIYECLNGEPEAFGVLVDKYKEGIYAFVYHKLRNFQDAQDVTQEVFLQAYRGLRSLRKWEIFSFWLYRIAYARSSQWLRIRSRRVDREFIEDQDSRALNDDSLNSYRDSQVSQSLREALDSLPEMHREVLLLHYFGGMSSKEIARAIGASAGAIRVRLSRARAQLRREMVDMMDTAFEGQKIPAGFTLRVVEAVRRIKINPMPRAAGLPWGLSLAVGVIIAVLSFSPHMIIPKDILMPINPAISGGTQILRDGEVSVDVLKITDATVTPNWLRDGKGSGHKAVDPQNALLMAPQAGDTWTKRSDMPTARSSLGLGVVNDKIYAIGGLSMLEEGGLLKFRYVKTVEEYDPATDTWTRKGDMPNAIGGCGIGVVNGKIYVIGGRNNDNDILSNVEEYDPKTGKWTEKADMPTKRSSFGTCVVNGKIYTIGGGTWESPFLNFSTVEEYDPVTDTWDRKSDMPTPRLDLSASAANGKIYAIGGLTHHVDLGNTVVEEYDPATDEWTRKADMPTVMGVVRRCFESVAVYGRIYVVGGALSLKPWSRVPTVDEYDPLMDKWVEKADMSIARDYPGISAVNGRIYAIGGSTVDGPISLVEEYDPGFSGMNIDSRGKLPMKWGEMKSD